MPQSVFDQQTAHMRGRYSQFYDRNGVLQQGDPYDHLSRVWSRRQAEIKERQAAAWRKKMLRTAAGGAALFGGGAALSSMFGPAAASSAAASSAAPTAAAGYTSPGIFGGVSFGAPTAGAATGAGASTMIAPAAATAGRLATIGKMFSSPGMALLVNSGLAYAGQRAQSRQADQARADLLAHNREALALQRQQLEQEAQNAALDRAERQALNAEINKLRRMELEAAEEERAYRRTVDEEERGYRRAREARLEPYRRISESAMNRLSSMWGLS